ncbi:hypothetical protein CVU75_02285 [Candidatus Dependentiae bacterium HGW-Dependentiae-1]|nr:MAG: hypothetical protein CVU75_02285 [Candidatus Dependentiae bacterium HGW-Dependentiae-1]
MQVKFLSISFFLLVASCRMCAMGNTQNSLDTGEAASKISIADLIARLEEVDEAEESRSLFCCLWNANVQGKSIAHDIARAASSERLSVKERERLALFIGNHSHTQAQKVCCDNLFPAIAINFSVWSFGVMLSSIDDTIKRQHEERRQNAAWVGAGLITLACATCAMSQVCYSVTARCPQLQEVLAAQPREVVMRYVGVAPVRSISLGAVLEEKKDV